MDHAPESTSDAPLDPAVGSTGVASVDRVLADVAAVVDAPVRDHVAVFERAHEQLRRALDAPTESADADEQGS